ncbi:MFS transporter [Actinomadura harenae]|uniref:MFS transporter n=1 Tax=Actinomadura harenae TaxID=2483351 RepID=A0A3M2LYA0_9ACTN|nr:MFS transporter [Actinomadura harenae]RMI42192.1 MFS transporter [Actinomadura harenae]
MGRWGPLTAVCLGAFMLLVDVNIVTVALPDMARGLGTTFGALQWVMDVYALTLAALLMGAGTLADRIGRRRLYVAGLVTFAASSLVSGLAPDAATLVAARAAQGVGAAAMFATTVALIAASYEGRDRAVAFGVWGAVSGAASGVGPILGGVLTQHLGWRWIFLVNLPVSAVAIAVTLRRVRESRNPAARRLDVPGIVLFAVAAGVLTYGLTRGGVLLWVSVAVAAVAFAGFAGVQRRTAYPTLDLGLFRRPGFVGVMIGSLAMSGTAFATLVNTSLWLRAVLGLSPMEAGLAILPLPAVAFATSLVAGRLLHGVSPRWTVGGGLALIGAGGLAQAFLTADSGWADLVPGLVLTGAGAGLALPNVTAAAVAAVPAERGGMASGAVGALRQLGYALGVAVLGAVFRARVPGDPAVSHDAAGFAAGLSAAYATAGTLALVAAASVLLLVRSRRDRRPAAVVRTGQDVTA